MKMLGGYDYIEPDTRCLCHAQGEGVRARTFWGPGMGHGTFARHMCLYSCVHHVCRWVCPAFPSCSPSLPMPLRSSSRRRGVGGARPFLQSPQATASGELPQPSMTISIKHTLMPDTTETPAQSSLSHAAPFHPTHPAFARLFLPSVTSSPCSVASQCMLPLLLCACVCQQTTQSSAHSAAPFSASVAPCCPSLALCLSSHALPCFRKTILALLVA